MPIFEFECLKCNAKFEEIILSSDNVEIKCPSCNDKNVRKLLSCFSFRGSSQKGGGDSLSACSSCTLPSCSSCGK